jgi:hypothetical protein
MTNPSVHPPHYVSYPSSGLEIQAFNLKGDANASRKKALRAILQPENSDQSHFRILPTELGRLGGCKMPTVTTSKRRSGSPPLVLALRTELEVTFRPSITSKKGQMKQTVGRRNLANKASQPGLEQSRLLPCTNGHVPSGIKIIPVIHTVTVSASARACWRAPLALHYSAHRYRRAATLYTLSCAD